MPAWAQELTKQVNMLTQRNNTYFQPPRRGGYSRGQSNRGSTQRSSNPDAHIICDFCQKLGHRDTVCFSKHGYPPGFNFNRPRRGRGNGGSTSGTPQPSGSIISTPPPENN